VQSNQSATTGVSKLVWWSLGDGLLEELLRSLVEVHRSGALAVAPPFVANCRISYSWFFLWVGFGHGCLFEQPHDDLKSFSLFYLATALTNRSFPAACTSFTFNP
jgi:hypothetical protein